MYHYQINLFLYIIFLFNQSNFAIIVLIGAKFLKCENINSAIFNYFHLYSIEYLYF